MTIQEAAARSDDDLVLALDNIFEPWNRTNAPGVVVGVLHRGRTLYRRGFGLASTELGLGNQPNMRMRIGSTTKHFTCLAIMLLAEEGKIDIDADIRTVLPEMPDVGTTITFRHLMQHTSGLRCHLDLSMLASGMSARLPDDQPLQQMFRARSLNFKPGERMIYCNGGYVLLSSIVERVSGMDLGLFFVQRIFQPLGMNDTRLLRRDGQLVNSNATLHVPIADGGYNRGQMIVPMSGDGGIISTVDDMLIWLRHMDAPSIGSAATWAAMKSPARFTTGVEGGYGFGLINASYRGVATLGHSGAVIGGSAEMIKVPAYHLDIVIMANMAGVSPVELAKRVIDTIIDSDLAAPAERPTIQDFEKFKGTYYASGTGVVVGLETQNDMAVLDWAGMKIPLWRGPGGEMFVSAASFDIRLRAPAGADAGSLSKIELFDCGIPQLFQRLGEAPDAEAAGADVLPGMYWSDELPAEAEIFRKGESLFLGMQGRFGRSVYALKPLAANLWVAYLPDRFVPYRIIVEIERSGDRVSGFHLSSGRTRRLAFARDDDGRCSPLRGDWHTD